MLFGILCRLTAAVLALELLGDAHHHHHGNVDNHIDDYIVVCMKSCCVVECCWDMHAGDRALYTNGIAPASSGPDTHGDPAWINSLAVHWSKIDDHPSGFRKLDRE